MWDDQGCRGCGEDSCPNVSSPVLMGVEGSSVKGVDYRTVGRMALSAMKRNKESSKLLNENKRDIQLHVDKAHILRKGGRWIRCHLQGGGLDDVLPRRGKDRGWQGYDR